MVLHDVLPGEAWLPAPNKFRKIEKRICGDPWALDYDEKSIPRMRRAVRRKQRELPSLGIPLGLHYNQDMNPYLVWRLRP